MRVVKLSPEPDVLSWGAALAEDEARGGEFALEDAAEDDFALDFVLCALEEEALDLKDPVLVVAGSVECCVWDWVVMCSALPDPGSLAAKARPGANATLAARARTATAATNILRTGAPATRPHPWPRKGATEEVERGVVESVKTLLGAKRNAAIDEKQSARAEDAAIDAKRFAGTKKAPLDKKRPEVVCAFAAHARPPSAGVVSHELLTFLIPRRMARSR